MMKVLVTGGSGYIGSHVVKLLKEQGHTPVVYDLMAIRRTWAHSGVNAISGDISNKWALEKLLEFSNFDAVIHLAASSEIEQSVSGPLVYYTNNVGGSAVLLEACKKYKISKVVFSSSSAVYGKVNVLPASEEDSKAPITSYGSSKLAVESMLRDVNVAHGIRSVSLRYFNASSAAPDASIGEFREHPTHLIPSLQAYREGRKDKFVLYGNNYLTRDGTAIRDYAHVWDIAQAHIDALEYLDKGRETVCLNVGSGSGSTVLEVVREFEKQTGFKINPEFKDPRPGDIPENWADISKAKSVLGWTPKRSKLETIIEDAVRWYSSETYKRLL
jgi:UDP-glucose-4-epimerase GalE